MTFTYPKSERLKSKNTIDLLFSNGKSVSKYPLRLVFVPTQNQDNQPIIMGVSVSKRYFKKAVDRNYFKRILRETYRKNKSILTANCSKQYSMMLFYQTKDRYTYSEIEIKTQQIFEKFIQNLNEHTDIAHTI
ncbi:ribonuclease P protein component [Flavobacterium branchiophilum NBRC 15030 = ATCC 35035]|nr:ribonuclease P protein component [Flavobacterium branchiophilum]OXA82244.1 ribonuclease P protein component [Flavobacterium branchiophilum NBRC 15030 = ATCC 35035]